MAGLWRLLWCHSAADLWEIKCHECITIVLIDLRLKFDLSHVGAKFKEFSLKVSQRCADKTGTGGQNAFKAFVTCGGINYPLPPGCFTDLYSTKSISFQRRRVYGPRINQLILSYGVVKQQRWCGGHFSNRSSVSIQSSSATTKAPARGAICRYTKPSIWIKKKSEPPLPFTLLSLNAPENTFITRAQSSPSLLLEMTPSLKAFPHTETQ